MEEEYLEEQEDEKDAMESLYEHNFELIDASPPYSYEIKVYPFESETDDDVNHVGVCLLVQYTETYPQTAPNIITRVKKGLHGGQLREIEALVQEKVEEGLEMEAPFIYDVSCDVQQWLLDHNIASNASVFDQANFEEEKRQKAEDEQRILSNHVVGMTAHSIQDYDRSHQILGTRVTEETFYSWNAEFMTEYRAHQASILEENERLSLPTGKEIFMEKSAQIVLPTTEENVMAFDESIFMEEMDLLETDI